MQLTPQLLSLNCIWTSHVNCLPFSQIPLLSKTDYSATKILTASILHEQSNNFQLENVFGESFTVIVWYRIRLLSTVLYICENCSVEVDVKTMKSSISARLVQGEIDLCVSRNLHVYRLFRYPEHEMTWREILHRQPKIAFTLFLNVMTKGLIWHGLGLFRSLTVPHRESVFL